MIIIGVDPGLIKTGFGIVKFENNNTYYVTSGTITTNTSWSIENRLKNIFDKLSEILNKYEPDCFSIEETFVNNNPISSLKLGQARGIAILCAGLKGLQVFEYKPNTIKKSVTGVGKASKNQIGIMIKCLLPDVNLKTEDEADALAIAICHINHSTMNKY